MGQSTNEWILGRVFVIPLRFAGAGDIITNLAKDKETGIEIIEITSFLGPKCN